MRRFTTAAPAIILALTSMLLIFAVPGLVRSATFARTEAQIVLARQTIADDDILERIDRAVHAICTAVEPSVVHIDILGGRQSDSPGRSSGSGWVWDDQGHIITNAHVVRDAERISVQFADGRAERAEVVATDVFTDIAVLKIDTGPGLAPARRATGKRPEKGDRVFAFGSPFGFKFSMSSGIVSGVGRDAQSDGRFGGYSNFIQTDAAVNPGNSGGPLIDVRGQVIGMNVAIATARDTNGTATDGQSAGISFAIPLPVIESVVEQLLTDKRVDRGFLGISLRGDAVPVRTSAGQQTFGVRVGMVQNDSPAARAGVRLGDLITHINNEPVPNSAVLRSLISISRPGTPAAVRVFREGELLDFTASVGRLPSEAVFEQVRGALPREVGLIARSQNGELIVTEVFEGSPAQRAGIAAGERIVSVGNTPTDEFWDFYRALVDEGILDNRPVKLVIERKDENGKKTTIPAQIQLQR
jgi:serine protease Do